MRSKMNLVVVISTFALLVYASWHPGNRAAAVDHPAADSPEPYSIDDLADKVIRDLQAEDQADHERTISALLELRSGPLMVRVLTDLRIYENALHSLRRHAEQDRLTMDDLPWLIDATMIWARQIDPQMPVHDRIHYIRAAGMLSSITGMALLLNERDARFHRSHEGLLAYLSSILERNARMYEMVGDADALHLCKWNLARLHRLHGQPELATETTDRQFYLALAGLVNERGDHLISILEDGLANPDHDADQRKQIISAIYELGEMRYAAACSVLAEYLDFRNEPNEFPVYPVPEGKIVLESYFPARRALMRIGRPALWPVLEAFTARERGEIFTWYTRHVMSAALGGFQQTNPWIEQRIESSDKRNDRLRLLLRK